MNHKHYMQHYPTKRDMVNPILNEDGGGDFYVISINDSQVCAIYGPVDDFEMTLENLNNDRFDRDAIMWTEEDLRYDLLWIRDEKFVEVEPKNPEGEVTISSFSSKLESDTPQLCERYEYDFSDLLS